MPKYDGLGSFDVGEIYRDDFIDELLENVEYRLNGVSPVDGDVPVKDLLEDLSVGHQRGTPRRRVRSKKGPIRVRFSQIGP